VLDSDVDILSWLDETEPVSSALPAKSARTDTLIAGHTSGTCFEINREVLLSLLEKAIMVVPSRDMIPVLTNFEISVEPGKISVIGSSTEMSIAVDSTQVEVKTPGTDLFPAKTFLSVVKEAQAGSSIYVEMTVHGLVIVAGAYTAEVAVSSSKGFPRLESLDDVVFHEIEAASFLTAINSVKYALPGRDYSGQDSMKMISIKGGKFTSCDGSRFQQVRVPGFKLNMQLPTFSINTLLKILATSDQEKLQVAETAKKLIFQFNNVLFYLNKMETPYPNVEQLWLRPALANDQELLVDRNQLITAIKQVKVTADSSSNAIGLIISETELKVVAKDTNNSAATTIPCRWSGKPRIVAVNYIHFAEMLKAYDKNECRFLLDSDGKNYKSPLLLKNDDTMSMATIAQMMAYRAGLQG
jgi:DNA polymerase III sliding clamp (beta) subunit (PCNA family)